jgi:phosphoribosylformimino-5-aminoimidazole carboxamide ribotide isomerase
MRLVPAIDLKGGLVVRGVGGRRDEYRPIISRLSSSSHPIEIAEVFHDRFGFNELYLADLDAISGQVPAHGLFTELSRRGFLVWADIGVRSTANADGLSHVVIGLETILGPDVLQELCRRFEERLLFSLDLKGGIPLGDVSRWPDSDPRALAAEAIRCGVRRLLVLDLAHVGERSGCGTESLCHHIATAHPDVELWAGGGVRDESDLERLRQVGVNVVLVASALHDGQLTAERISHVAD